MVALSELLGLLEAFDKELLASLPVDGDELRVEISRVYCASFISPRSCVRVIKGQLHGDLAILLVHLKLFRHWSLDSSLQFFNLVSVESIIIKHLPLLNGSLVEMALALSDLLLADNFLDPVFKLNEHLTREGVLGWTADVAFAEGVHHLVVLVLVASPVLVITFERYEIFRGLFKGGPQLSELFWAAKVSAGAGQFEIGGVWFLHTF